MSQEQQQLTYMKGVVADLPKEQQDELYAKRDAILAEIANDPSDDAQAILLISLTMALLQFTIDNE